MERVAFITGGTKGIGFHIAKQLGEQGVKVIVAARNEDSGALQQLRENGATCDFFQMDVLSDEDIVNYFSKLGST